MPALEKYNGNYIKKLESPSPPRCFCASDETAKPAAPPTAAVSEQSPLVLDLCTRKGRQVASLLYLFLPNSSPRSHCKAHILPEEQV